MCSHFCEQYKSLKLEPNDILEFENGGFIVGYSYHFYFILLSLNGKKHAKGKRGSGLAN